MRDCWLPAFLEDRTVNYDPASKAADGRAALYGYDVNADLIAGLEGVFRPACGVLRDGTLSFH